MDKNFKSHCPGVMSKIPRPSPRSCRDLPITDEEKSAALPKKATGKLIKGNKIPDRLTTVAISSAAFPSTSTATTELTENMMDQQCASLNRSKSESDIRLDQLSINGKVKIGTSLAKQATNLPSAVKKVEVPKGVVKLRKCLSFRDKKPAITEKPRREQTSINLKTKLNIGNANNIPPAVKTKTAEPFKSKSGKLIKNQENRPKAEFVTNRVSEKVNKKPNLNKRTEAKQQNGKASEESELKNTQVKSLDKQNSFPEFKDAIQDASELQIKFCSPREAGHSGLKFAEKPKKKAFSARNQPSKISSRDCDSSSKLPKKDSGGM